MVANLDSDASDQNKKFAKLSLTAKWIVWYAKSVSLLIGQGTAYEEVGSIDGPLISDWSGN